MATEFLDESQKRLLSLDTRRRIYEVVKRSPGCHFREIVRRCGLPAGTVRYHLAYLCKHHLVKLERDENNSRYFPRDFQPDNRRLMGLLRQKRVREILLFILLHEGCHHEDIVQAVGIAPSTVSWHLKKLEEHRVITSTRRGRKTSYDLAIDQEAIIKLLITYQESFLDALVDHVIEMWE